ncbi:MAG: aldose 1-epimerase family protein [Mucilaginibacter sp.]|nr:aldose 1-epimerase family protein [Mucilaginibacter sp.]
MTIIQNDHYKIAIRTQGGELTSFYSKSTGIEHLWQADTDIWPWYAPTLFPIVGALNNNQLLVDGQAYPMARHGFNRQSELLLLESDAQSAKFSLPYCEKTLEVYPYKFDFQIHYDLIDTALRVTYKVINLDKKDIYFSVGGHPGFNVPFNKGEQYEDYYLEFEAEEKLYAHLLSSEGTFTGETQLVQMDGNKLPLNRDLFINDALVFKNMKSRMVTIKSTKHDQSLSVEFPHFNYLGIWAKTGGDFICIEPWLGCADTQGKQTDISQKEGIQKLNVGHVFESAFFISL